MQARCPGTYSATAALLTLAGLVLFSAALSAPVAARQGPSQLSQQEVELEEKKLTVERQKMWLTAGSIVVSVFVPLFIGAMTLRSQARVAFELKAAELVLSSASPWVAQGRVNVLKSLFRERLGDHFAASFNKEEFPGVRHTELKLALFEALAQDPAKKEQVVQLWRDLFPNEKAWFDELPLFKGQTGT